jgi:hypothetical protein
MSMTLLEMREWCRKSDNKGFYTALVEKLEELQHSLLCLQSQPENRRFCPADRHTHAHGFSGRPENRIPDTVILSKKEYDELLETVDRLEISLDWEKEKADRFRKLRRI